MPVHSPIHMRSVVVRVASCLGKTHTQLHMNCFCCCCCSVKLIQEYCRLQLNIALLHCVLGALKYCVVSRARAKTQAAGCVRACAMSMIRSVMFRREATFC